MYQVSTSAVVEKRSRILVVVFEISLLTSRLFGTSANATVKSDEQVLIQRRREDGRSGNSSSL